MSDEEINRFRKFIETFIPKYRLPDKCALCGKKLGYFDHLRGKCSCQMLTAEDLNKKMTI